MRRNQSLYWRALAVLGALLSVLIEWPTGLAMQVILPTLPTASSTASMITSVIYVSTKTKKSQPDIINTNTSSNSNSSQSNIFNTSLNYVNINLNSNNIINNNNNISDSTKDSYISANERNFNHQLGEIYRTRNTSEHSESEIRSRYEEEDPFLSVSKIIAFKEDDHLGIISSSDDNSRTTITTTTTAVNIVANNSYRIQDGDDDAVISRTERSMRNSDITTVSHKGIKHLNGSAFIVVEDNDGVAESATTDSITNAGGNVNSIKSRRLINHNSYRHNNNTNSSNLDRNERSTISHLSGPARKIQLYIKNRFIQLMPDGTVNGTQDDLSDYTILQRTTVDVGRIKIQGVATCLYLCMDQCGTVYGSKEFTDDCVFNESMEQHNYNTYSSTYNSNSRRIYYLALNRHGEPRKLQIPPSRSLGKLATYTKAITETVPQDRVEQLIAKFFGANRVKHGIRQLCDTGKPLVGLTNKVLKAQPKCNPTNISNSNINNNGQLLNNVPAANDKSRISNTSNYNTNRNSHSNNLNNSNGHTSNNINNNHILKKKKKKKRCRPNENEDEHNCQRGPQPLKKRPSAGGVGNINKRKCKENSANLGNGGNGTILECASKRPKKGGPNNRKQLNGARHNQKKNVVDGKGTNNRRGKKLHAIGRQANGGNNGSKNGQTNKRQKNGNGGGRKTTTTSPKSSKLKITANQFRPEHQSTTIPATITSAIETTTQAPYTTITAIVTSTRSKNNYNDDSNNERKRDTQAHLIFGSVEDKDEDESTEDSTFNAEYRAEADNDDDDNDHDTEVNSDGDDGNDGEFNSGHFPFNGDHTHFISGSDDILYDDQFDL